MAEHKISYFDIRGRAEPIRLAFVIGKQPFTDDRFSAQDFDKRKADLPYKAAPTLTINEDVYAQSSAIMHYVGKKTGLYPTDDLEALKCDEICETVTDVFWCIYRYRGPDEEKKRSDRKQLVEEDLPRYVGGMEKRLQKFSEGPFVLGDQVSIADAALVSLVNTFRCGIIDYVDKDILAVYERVMESYWAVMELPEVAEWYKKWPIANVTK